MRRRHDQGAHPRTLNRTLKRMPQGALHGVLQGQFRLLCCGVVVGFVSAFMSISSTTSVEAGPFAEPITYSDLPGWQLDDHAAALHTFQLSCNGQAGRKRPNDPGWLAACDAAQSDDAERNPRAFFEAYFEPFQRPDGDGRAASGILTGYYEPEVAASRVPTADFTVPLYRRPHDLVAVTPSNRPTNWDAALSHARQQADGRLVPFFDRATIETGALEGRALELVWLADPVDAFFIHIQGSARLALADGTSMRVGYAGKTGHPFTPIGRLLVERGEMDLADASMTGIRAWLAAHPEEGTALMHENRSFIFFIEKTDSDPSLGPEGAAGLQLTPGRSLAIDPAFHAYGMPIWLQAEGRLADHAGLDTGRLVISQDTGSAIKGRERGDLFVGSGEAAGELAGRIRQDVRFVVLRPRSLR